jgi:spore germination cell wall hydrolase CwlJ-like protein
METTVSGLRGPSERLLPALLGAVTLCVAPSLTWAATTVTEPVAPLSQSAIAQAGTPPQTSLAAPTSLLDAQRARAAVSPSASRSSLDCMARAIYYEARAEPLKGQMAVAEVVMNRTKSGRYPRTVCGVVEQRTSPRSCQFSFVCDRRLSAPYGAAWTRAKELAAKVMAGKAPRVTDGATHFHATRVSPNWSRVYTLTAQIGNHLFYRKGGARRAIAQNGDGGRAG